MLKNADKLVLNEVLYVPSHLVTSEILDAWTYHHDKKITERISMVRSCEYCKWWNVKKNGRRDTCCDAGYTRVCPDFSPATKTSIEPETVVTYLRVDENTYSFGRGDLGKIQKYFGKYEIEDQRSAPRLGYDLRCTTELYEDQKRVVEEWLNIGGGGFLKAPTGWGKSIALCWLIAKIGLKTIILSQETRHLQVVIDGLYKHTNLRELEETHGVHILGKFGEEYCNKKGRDYVKKNKTTFYPICLSTYQNFYSDAGKTALQEAKNEFGFLWIEEAHHEAATTFHNVVRSFNTYYRGGASATPKRDNDNLHVAIFDTIGKITATGKTIQMVPQASFIHTGVEIPKHVFQHQYPVPTLHSYLGSSQEYREIVFKYFKADIENGRVPLLISERRNFAVYIHEQVKMSGYESVLLMGGMSVSSQDEINVKLMDGSLNCIVGTKVLRENVNFPRLCTLHLPFPNFTRGLEEQMVGRIQRYIKDDDGNNLNIKPTPLIRVYTYIADHKIPESALKVRRSLYKSWGFKTIEEIEEYPREINPVMGKRL